ncbi:MAG TPA: hypothetical protein VNL70_03090 [Tepidisphaeraceae bacterium]|nr:hypothetical protein [Tepidisphaeraceae bacterium]
MGIFDYFRRRPRSRKGLKQGSSDRSAGITELLGSPKEKLAFLRKRRPKPGQMEAAEFFERLLPLQNWSQVSILIGLWHQGYKLADALFRELPEELDAGEVARYLRAEMALALALEQEAEGTQSQTSGTLQTVAADNREAERLLELARQASATADRHSGLLTPSIGLDAPLTSPWKSVTLIQSGYFNPNGPALCDLTLEHAPAEGALVVFNSAHPFSPFAAVFGFLSDSNLNDVPRLFDLLRTLFRRNGSETHPLMASLPTHACVPEGSLLNSQQLRELFAEAAAAHAADDFGDIVRRYRKHWCKPWDRTQEEMMEALRSLASGSASSPQARRTSDLDRGQFDEWFGVITHPEHVEAELQQIPLAWKGSIDQLKGIIR